MKKYNKEEIKNLIREVIQERWTDIFKKKISKEDLYLDVYEWMEDMLDEAGRYNGPRIPGFTTGKFVVSTEPPYTLNHLEEMQRWNKEFGLNNDMPYRDIISVNQIARDRFYNEYPNAILGDFPNQ